MPKRDAARPDDGEEFTEPLIADITERPRSAARGLDVARGLAARSAS